METQSARNVGTYVFTAHGVRIYKNTSISDGNVLCYCIVKIAPAPANKKIQRISCRKMPESSFLLWGFVLYYHKILQIIE